MPLLRINATSAGLALHDSPQSARQRLSAMSCHAGPAIVMVHGYKYTPHLPGRCPHQRILGGALHNWPHQLGFEPTHRADGLGIAFGWSARGPLHKVYRRAADLGESLAAVISQLRAHRPERPVHIVAHSLGCEIALSALGHLPSGSVDRMVLMTGASFARHAERMLGSPAGRTAEVLNVTSRENDLFDAIFERLVPPPTRGDRAIGQGIAAPNVATIELDCTETLLGLRRLGAQVADPTRRICHWSAYRRPGVMALYNRFLRRPADLLLRDLQDNLPGTRSPRWSRLLSRWPDRSAAAGIALPPTPRRLGSLGHELNAPLLRREPDEPAY
ncbi:alpha/beta hydrolase family protein [Roseobacter weihaiensis]|uniref:alpha/beta fold hydrolase n=1 Tax=Roseobacter weihaiensis TaxID=2763262 RepID=UPI001D0BDE72|nr:alpha/beta fold hydrolase [Roseobacter sp. H9]